MKIRKGLVSNSSSSSFICDVCGHAEGGWDRSAGELGFAVCVNGHTICIDHVLFDTEDEREKYRSHIYENPYDTYTYKDMEFDYEIPEALCPCCQLNEISKDDFNRWLVKTGKMGKLKKEFAEQFPTYNSFKKWLTK